MTAKDPEGDEFALRLPDKKVPFAISSDGQLTVNGPLDREQKDEYQFEVIGMDSYLRKSLRDKPVARVKIEYGWHESLCVIMV